MSGNNGTVFALNLCCTDMDSETQTRQSATITFPPSFPNPITVNDLMQRIENEFEIPQSVVRLEVESLSLRTGKTLAEYGIREKDTIIVYYCSKADCKEIDGCIEWMKIVVCELRSRERGLAGMSFIGGEGCLDYLCLNFNPWLDSHKYANKIYFISKNGLRLVSDIMQMLAEPEISNSTGTFKSIEASLLDCLWSLTEDSYTYQAVIDSGGIDNCTHLLLRLPVRFDSANDFEQLDKDVLKGSLGTLANICELPEAAVTVCHNRDVIKQVFAITLCSDFGSQTVYKAVTMLKSLSYVSKIHSSLILVEGFREFVQTTSRFIGEDIAQLIEFNKAVTCCILMLMSSQVFTTELKDMVYGFLNWFLQKYDLTNILKYEQDVGIHWSRVKPLVTSLYQCNMSPSSPDDVRLFDLCKEILVITMQDLVTQKHHRDVLVREGMVDYVLCLPWYSKISAEMLKKVNGMVAQMIRNPDVDYQPPSLVNMCKAAVAVHYCGLETVMSLSVPELACKIFHSE